MAMTFIPKLPMDYAKEVMQLITLKQNIKFVKDNKIYYKIDALI